MAVKIRLTRRGSKKRPFYRMVAADSEAPRDGKFLEIIGTYNPLKEPAEVIVNQEKLTKWIKRGAQPTSTVKSLLRKNGIWKGILAT
ncbi:MAG TPA: 30S ribosomal protein S16 [Syntrophaceae bacterium]|nr:30S ribosomal protein S16 [Syntrophaceae bacterium]